MAKKLSTEDQERIEHAREALQKWLGEGGVIYTITRYSQSRMSRWVRVLVPVNDPLYRDGKPEIVDITYYIAQVTTLKLDDDGLKFGGYGFDADTDIVAHLQRVLGLEPEQSANGYRQDKITARKLVTY